MTKIQKAVSVFSIAAASLLLPCAAEPAPEKPVANTAEKPAKAADKPAATDKPKPVAADKPAAVEKPAAADKPAKSADKPVATDKTANTAPAPAAVPPVADNPPAVPAQAPDVAVDGEADGDSGDEAAVAPAPADVAAAPAPAAEPAAAPAAPPKTKPAGRPLKFWSYHKPVSAAPAEGEGGEGAASPPYYGKPVKFGGRIAYNNAYVPALNVTVEELDMASGGDIIRKEYTHKPGLGGSGFEIGAAADIRIAWPFSVYTGLNFVIRNPVSIKGPDSNEGVLKISEMAVNVPVLLRVMLGPVYVDAGGQFDMPFGSKIKYEWWEEAEKFESRQKIDFGAVLGLGSYILEGLFADAKGVIGLMRFDEEHGKPVYQISVGIGYMY